MFKNFLDDETGATAIEYGLIAALIAIGIIGGARMLGAASSKQMWCLNAVVDDVGPMSHPACPGYGDG